MTRKQRSACIKAENFKEQKLGCKTATGYQFIPFLVEVLLKIHVSYFHMFLWAPQLRTEKTENVRNGRSNLALKRKPNLPSSTLSWNRCIPSRPLRANGVYAGVHVCERACNFCPLILTRKKPSNSCLTPKTWCTIDTQLKLAHQSNTWTDCR